MKLTPIIILAALILSGCSTRYISHGDSKYFSGKLGNKEEFGGLSITNTNGVSVKLDGYKSDQVQATEAAVRAAVEAAIGVK